MAFVAVALALAPASVSSQSIAASRILEAHVWSYDTQPGSLTPGAADDFWTLSGVHYRFDGTILGKLVFSDRLGGAPEGPLDHLRVGARGQVFVTGVWSGLGPSLSAHDLNGQQLWIRPIGRPGRKGPAKGSIRRTGQDEPSSEIVSAEILGVDAAGNVQISGWLQGCVDLASRPDSFVACATLNRAGKYFDDDVDAYPQLFFSSRFDETGGWKGSRTFPRLPAGQVAWSSVDDVLAVTTGGSWRKPLVFEAPAGTRASIPFKDDDSLARSLVVLLDPSGHLGGTLHLLAHEAQIVRSFAFDATGSLWMLIEYSPSLDVRGPGTHRAGRSLGRCVSLLSLAKKDEVPYFHSSFCKGNRAENFSVSVSSASDGRVIVSGAPAEMVYDEVLEPPPGLSLPPPPRDYAGKVSSDYVATHLVVTRQGNPYWSSPIPAAHAIGLPDGWICFETSKSLACVRPMPAQRPPG